MTFDNFIAHVIQAIDAGDVATVGGRGRGGSRRRGHR